MKIPAIDLGKVKSVACDYENRTTAHQFETARTGPVILEDLLRRRRPDRCRSRIRLSYFARSDPGIHRAQRSRRGMEHVRG